MEKSARISFLRIIDANFNRAKEALRVSEDFSRFLMNDRSLTSEFKKTRHQLTRILLNFPARYADLLNSRKAASDVGRHTILKDKPGPLKWQDLMTANLKRAQEAVRVLEEMSKVVQPSQAKGLQKLRFHLYELEKRSFQKF